jgi:site-specific DNA-methyltransferase (adenine-specific)
MIPEVKLYQGNMRIVLPLALEANSIDTCICDPPYGLDFMGKDWDHGVPGVQFWREVRRVLKPGATLMAFGGTRTHHRLMVAIEDAGFELRDTMMWVYGSGFPKSHDISKAIDKAAGAEREVVGKRHSEGGRSGSTSSVGQHLIDAGRKIAITAPATPEAQTWDGWGTALKPAWEPIIVAMNPRDGTFVENAFKWGVAGLWIDGGRISLANGEEHKTRGGRGDNGGVTSWQPSEGYDECQGRWPANFILQHHPECVRRGTKRVRGNGGSSTVNDNGKGWYETKGDNHRQRYADPDGKETVADWDCHPDCAVRLLAEQSGESTSSGGENNEKYDNTAIWGSADANWAHYGDTGTAARFFYCAKASPGERDCDGMVENHHPTVKPVEILRYLCRLTKTPTGGVVLDPFMGSGSTGIAAVKEQRDFIGVELRGDYLEIARARIEHAMLQPRLI